MRILIADDDPMLLRLLEAHVKRWGHQLTIANDGFEALAALEADPELRLVLSDWDMPGMTGVELCRRIRELDGRPYTYVMLLTAKDASEDLIHAFHAGVDEFITKPFRPRELQMRLDAAARLLVQMSEKAADRAPLAVEPGTVVAGRYRLTNLLGAGGMGTVWEAEHIGLACTVAVKFLRPEHTQTESFRSRFETEARVAARVISPYTVRVYDYGLAEGGVPFLVMEHLRGVSLADTVGEHGPMGAPAAAKMVRQVATALARAHAAGVVHRDVKPENILLAEEELAPGELTAKLIDFGVAKVMGVGAASVDPSRTPKPVLLTEEGVLVGTPHYMSPEYLGGCAKPDPRLDLWGLAVSAYVAIVGALPFDGDTAWVVVGRVCNDPLPIPSKRHNDVPAGFDAWFSRACSRDPEERFASADDLARSLEEICCKPELAFGARPSALTPISPRVPTVRAFPPAAPAPMDTPLVCAPTVPEMAAHVRRRHSPVHAAALVVPWGRLGGVVALALLLLAALRVVLAR